MQASNRVQVSSINICDLMTNNRFAGMSSHAAVLSADDRIHLFCRSVLELMPIFHGETASGFISVVGASKRSRLNRFLGLEQLQTLQLEDMYLVVSWLPTMQ